MNFIKRWKDHTCDSIFVLIYISDTQDGLSVQCGGVFSTLGRARREMKKQFKEEKNWIKQEGDVSEIDKDVTGVFADSACIRVFDGEYRWIIEAEREK